MRARSKQERPERGVESRATPLKANLDDLAIADLLQTLVRTGKDAVVTIEHDGQLSRVWCKGGDIIDAESPPLGGVDAFGHILSIERGCVTAEFQAANRPVTIRLPLQALIVEHVRLLEEKNAQQSESPSPSIESSVNKIAGSKSWMDMRLQAASDDASPRSGGSRALKSSAVRHRSTSARAAMNTETVPFAEEDITARHQEMSALVQRPANHESVPVEPTRRKLGVPLILLASAVVVALALWAVLASRPSPVAHTTAETTRPLETSRAPSADPKKSALELDVSAEPASAEFRLDGSRIAVGHAVRSLPADGREHVLEVSAEGHVARTIRFTDAAPSGRITLAPKPALRASEHPSAVAREPRMPANVAPSGIASRRPSKSDRAEPLSEDTKSDAAHRIDIVPTPRDPHIRVIESGDPKIKMLE